MFRYVVIGFISVESWFWTNFQFWFWTVLNYMFKFSWE